MQAYYRLESLELVSRIVIAGRILGKAKPLSEEQIRKLKVVRARHGWGGTAEKAGKNPPAQAPEHTGTANIDVERVAKIISDAIREQNI